LRRNDEFDRDVVQAWRVVAIYAQSMKNGRLPDIRKFLSSHTAGAQGEERQSVGQMRGALAILSAQYGIPVKWGPKGET
jgi:hypothetical protein